MYSMRCSVRSSLFLKDPSVNKTHKVNIDPTTLRRRVKTPLLVQSTKMVEKQGAPCFVSELFLTPRGR